MAVRNWIVDSGDFGVAANWSPDGVPVAGDTAVITAGTLNLSGALPAAFVLRIASTRASSPVAVATDLAIAAGTQVQIVGDGTNATLRIVGTATNAGAITFGGSSPGTPTLALVSSGAGPTTLTNTGGISMVDTQAALGRLAGAVGDMIVNNGTISARTSTSTGYVDTIGAAIGGTGTIRVGANETLRTTNIVGSGQTVLLEAGVGQASVLEVNSGSQFHGKIAGFGVADTISAITSDWDSYGYAGTAQGGTLSLSRGTHVVQTFDFVGAYTASSFSLTGGGGSDGFTQTMIHTTVADAAGTINFTDTVTGVSGVDTAAPYSDPNVPYLRYAYNWTSANPVAIATTADNVFLHGGAGGDALVAHGGNNVIDGGGGSNYLIGATGADGGKDVFFVDGRGSVETWSTILNFHPGDLAVIFGFRNGVSTQPWTASDGAAGATGATLHSELNGAGTGINGSITFAGVDLATVNSRFSFSYGAQATEGNDYILVQYT